MGPKFTALMTDKYHMHDMFTIESNNTARRAVEILRHNVALKVRVTALICSESGRIMDATSIDRYGMNSFRNCILMAEIDNQAISEYMSILDPLDVPSRIPGCLDYYDYSILHYPRKFMIDWIIVLPDNLIVPASLAMNHQFNIDLVGRSLDATLDKYINTTEWDKMDQLTSCESLANLLLVLYHIFRRSPSRTLEELENLRKVLDLPPK